MWRNTQAAGVCRSDCLGVPVRRSSRPSRPRSARPGAASVLLAGALALVTACSSAPAPDRVDSAAGLPSDGVTDDPAADGTTPDGASTDPGTTADGAVVDGQPGGAAGGAAGGTSTGTAGGSSGTSSTGSATGSNGASTGSTGSGGAAGGTQAPAGSSPAAAGGTTSGGTPTRSTLFTAKENTIGITPTSITLCAHAALTYGKAFNTEDADFNVYWSALNDAGGIFGRKVTVTYENDDYKPDTAVVAARACKAKNPFILLGGIGFDQIPAVRNYVEKEHILYLHHTATVNGSKGLKYSFTEVPTVERLGEGFGQLYASRYAGQKVGIIKRDSDNWEPGVVAFKSFLTKTGGKVVAERAVAQNKGNYTDEILAMKNAGAQVVWIWDNALDATAMVRQFKAQAYSPRLMLFPFNLTSQTLGDDALKPTLDGLAMFTAYSKGDRSGPFASYADDLKQFEQQYAKYRPNVDLGGNGGDLLFLNWQAQKALAVQLADCGKDCTRNRFVDTLQGYNKKPTSSACTIDFTKGDGQHGSDQVVFMETYKAPDGKVNWRNTRACVGRG